MELEFIVNERTKKVKLLEQNHHHIKLDIDGKIYNLDVARVKDYLYSILYEGKSYNIELTTSESGKVYTVNSLYNSFDIEVLDAQTKYQMNRNRGGMDASVTSISSPMPGKVVKILVQEGDELKSGQTAIIVEAMKMQSEYKAKNDCRVKRIHVAEGQTVDSHQVLIDLE